ncbi:hypothetical protein MLD38_030054 [Melastoma candidum]|uniref:Uncharacterized protein n=1 Tax=Melastoma candidum TaxID=119954 RepID=A0ACB9MMK0_9MYRT|nr:hypothetical protein MLD38_030054 [Melastoma candidum]
MFLLKRIVVLAAVIACFFVPAKTVPNIEIINRQCFNQLVSEVGDAERAINDVFDKLLSDTITNGYNYKFQDVVGDDHIWGNAACNGNLPPDDCTKCLDIAKDYILQLCGFAGGAHCKLQDCRLRYEPYEFNSDW